MLNYRISAFADEYSPDIDMQISAMKKNGVGLIEIRNIGPKNAMELPMSEIKEVRKKLDAAGMGVSSLGSQIGRLSIEADPAGLYEDLKKACENACGLGAERMRILSFNVQWGTHEQVKDEVVDRIGKMLDIAEGYGILLCSENEPGLYADSAAHVRSLYDVFGKRLGYVFDPCNFIYSCTDPLRDGYDLLSRYITYFHIKDCIRSDGVIVPCGMGDGGIPEILALLNNSRNGEMILTVEPHLRIESEVPENERERMRSRGNMYSDKDEMMKTAIDSTRNSIPLSGRCV